MPPTDNSPQATILYLSRLLAAIALDSPEHQVRIGQTTLDEISGAEGKRALFEDYDEKTKQIVLTYREKSRATYLVEGVPASTTQPTPITPTMQNQSRMPLTDDQITNLERRLQREKQFRAIKNEPQPSFKL